MRTQFDITNPSCLHSKPSCPLHSAVARQTVCAETATREFAPHHTEAKPAGWRDGKRRYRCGIKVLGAILGPAKSDTASPTPRHRCDGSSKLEAVLPGC